MRSFTYFLDGIETILLFAAAAIVAYTALALIAYFIT